MPEGNWIPVKRLALALLLGLGVALAAQGFSVEQALSYPFPDGLTAAAHAPIVAWVFNARGARNVWVAQGPDYHARAVTNYAGDDGMPIASLRLTPDGSTAVYVRGSETNARGEVADPTSGVAEPQQEVWAVDVAGGTPRKLGTMDCRPEGCEDVELSPDGRWAVWSARRSLWLAPVSGAAPAQRLAYIRGDVTQPRWAPDGNALAFSSDRGTHALIGIWRRGAATIQWIAPSVFRDSMPRWSPDGKQLAFIRLLGGGGEFFTRGAQPWAIYVADAATGAAKPVWRSPAGDSVPGEWEDMAFQFAAGNQVVFAGQADGWVHLYAIAAGGSPARLLTPGAFSIAPAAVTQADNGRALLYASNQNDTDRRHIWRVDVAGGAPRELTPGAGLEWAPVAADGNVFFFGATATRPAMPFRLTSQGPQLLASEALPADYPSAQMVTPEAVVFRSADGLEVHGQLFVPRRHNRRLPGLVFMHGGPPRQMMLGFHPMDAYNYMYAANQYLASRGYVVLSVNYRLSIMYGQAFREPAHGGPQGASEYQDIVAGARYLQALPYVNPDKIGLWGGSYGGYLTAMGLARNSDIFKAGVDYAGVHDWTALLPGVQGAARQTALAASPVADLDRWKSPVLLMQADDDRNVPFAQTVTLVHQLRARHIPYELIVFPDGIHDSLRWQAWVENFTATADFFDRILVRGEAVKPQ